MKAAIWIPCFGEVHGTMGDGCIVCLGHGWERLAACPTCVHTGEDLGWREGRARVLTLSQSRKTGRCAGCDRMFKLDRSLPHPSLPHPSGDVVITAPPRPLVDRVDLHRLRDPEQWRAVAWQVATRAHTYREGTLAECLAWIAAEVAS